MATASNLTFTGKGIAEDFHDMIYDISPTETPLMSMAKRYTANNTFHQWQEDSLAAATTNAQLEGDDASFSARTQPTVLGNYTQIATKTVSISGTFEAVKKYGRKSEIARELIKMGKELKRDIEYAIVRNQASTAGAAASARTTGSIESWIATVDGGGNGVRANGTTTGTTSAFASNTVSAPTDGSATAIVEADLQSALALAWADGGDPSVIMCSAANKRRINAFTGIATKYNEVKGATQATIVGAADMYVSDFGNHRVVLNRYMREQAVLCLDPEHVGLAFLRPIQRKPLGQVGDSQREMMVTEFAFVVTNRSAHAKIINCG